MKKTEKISSSHWTRCTWLTILSTLFLNVFIFPGASPADLAAQSSQEEVEKLRSELAEARRMAQEKRRKYAEMLLVNQNLLDELAELRLQVVNMLGGRSSDSFEGRQVAALEALLEARRQHETLYREVYDFGDYLQDVLEIVQPSRALRQEIEERYSVLPRTVTRLEFLPSIVAWRGGELRTGREVARVLQYEQELQVAVLSVGESDQVRPGSIWQVVDDSPDTRLTKLKVVVTRANISAAIPVEGEVARIVPGIRAELVQTTGN